MNRRRTLCVIAPMLALLLAACENSATAYTIDTNQHALALVREQPYFWTDSVNQFIVVSRLPACQRKVAIHSGATALAEMDVFEAGDLLWALRQDNRWYLAGTENCLVQDWDNRSGEPPGPLVGAFRLRDGEPAFVPAAP